ncbi:hypothetical protein Tco_0895532 [Tanacetum coccineum]|uniref:Uncharacterized protein n=1 Tax=Tanacetum coccineum TaxID=301880 RepID=A0ABQ5CF79_9ASTR
MMEIAPRKTAGKLFWAATRWGRSVDAAGGRTMVAGVGGWPENGEGERVLRESSFQNIRPRRFLRSGSHSNVGCKKSCQSSKYGSDLGQITRIEEELTWVKTFGKEVEEYVTKVIAKDGTVTRFGGRFPHFIEEEEEKKPKPYNLYGFVDLMENEQVYAKTGFAPYRIPQSEGNHNG